MFSRINSVKLWKQIGVVGLVVLRLPALPPSLIQMLHFPLETSVKLQTKTKSQNSQG
jgi:hypothetical protein